jgi:hypothetical protein
MAIQGCQPNVDYNVFYPFSQHLQANFKGKSTSTMKCENLQSQTGIIQNLQLKTKLWSKNLQEFETFSQHQQKILKTKIVNNQQEK